METVKTIKNLSDYFNRFTFHISDVYHIVTCTRKYKSKIFLWCCIFTLPLNVVNHELNWTILLDTLSVLTSEFLWCGGLFFFLFIQDCESNLLPLVPVVKLQHWDDGWFQMLQKPTYMDFTSFLFTLWIIYNHNFKT